MPILSRIILIAFAVGEVACLHAAPAHRPFPQHSVYAKGTIKPANVSQEALDAATAAVYESWKRKYLHAGCTPGESYVMQGDRVPEFKNAISISEGHGYGMVITALMAGHDPDARANFDALFRFYRSHPSKNNARLMAWCQIKGCVNAPRGSDSASDGDLDIAYSLLLADKQWGSDGSIDYLGEAKLLIEAILESEINKECHSVKLGDDLSADDSMSADIRSSDMMLGHFRSFAKVVAAGEWNAVADKCYAVIDHVQNEYSPETGLLPDFIVHLNSSPAPARPKYLESRYDGAYYYNACRVPFRLALDYLMASDPRSKRAVQKINRWIREETSGDPRRISAGYFLGGKPIDHADHPMCFVAPLAVGAMVDRENQEWLNRLWESMVESRDEDETSFDAALKLLSMLVISGNWWEP